jgi:acyl carrier protein
MDRREQCREQLAEVFREVFADPALRLEDSFTPHNISGWDSVRHVHLVVAIEDRFNVTFSTAEVASLQRVGDIVDVIVARGTV